MKKSFEAMRKKKMDGQADNQAFTPGLMDDFKCGQCELKGK